MDPDASSLLLHCLAQLGQDTVAQVVLPKLLQQGSGPALAATCSQLRVLVHSSITCLALHGFWRADNPGLTEAWTAALRDHFPSCTHVFLEGPFPVANHSIPYVISALARLPNLDAISIKAMFTVLPIVALSTALYCMRTQLTGLKRLTLEMWKCDAIGLGCTWQELGRSTQLTALDVKLMSAMEDDLYNCNYIQDAVSLSALQRLLVLRVTDECSEEDEKVDWSFVSCLTTLTELAVMTLGIPEGRTAVGSCMALRDLTLFSPGDPQLAAALAQLTGLTRLNLESQWVHAGCECAQALSCLTNLRWLGAGMWSHGLLPVLQRLPQLSTISGNWDRAAAQLGNVQLPQVCQLLHAGGCTPLEAFPRLIFAQLDGLAAPPGVLAKLPTCCPQLQELELGLFHVSIADTPAVTKGMQSLSLLRHLRGLQLQVCNELQLAAAAAACRVLGQGSLNTLRVSVRHCNFSSLLLLSSLAKLDVLHLVFSRASAFGQQSQEVVCIEDAGLLLSGLSAVQKVVICCQDDQVQAVLRAAPAWAAECGLPVPCEVDMVVPRYM